MPPLVSPSRYSLLLLAVLVPMLVLGASGNALASAETDRAAAIGLAKEGRCEPALEAFAGLQSSPPNDAELAQLQGECALRLQDFRLAISSLELARTLDPSAQDLDLHLGMAYYHAGQIENAEAALIRVGARDGNRPEFLLYSGLVAYARSDYPAAMGRLNAASQLREAQVEPMASFFLGRAALGADERDRASDAFRRVIEEHPGTSWSQEAARALEGIEGGAGTPWWLGAEIGFEHDDNALLRGTSVSLPSDIAGQSDQRAFWFVDVGATLFDLGETSGGAMLRYGGSEHHDLERFDAHAPGGTLWLDQDLGLAGMSLRLQYDFDVTWIDARSIESDPFVLSHLVGMSGYKPWEGGAYTVATTAVGVDDYRYERFDQSVEGTGVGLPCGGTATFCGPAGLDENSATDRDGVGLRLSLLHHVPLPFEQEWFAAPWIEGEVRYQRYWSEGSEYDHHRAQIELGIGARLPFEIGLRVSGRYAYLPYDNASVFPDPSDVAVATGSPGNQYFLSNNDREEHETGVRISLERAIGEHVVMTARYSRTRNRSNADVFDYARDLFGVSVRVALGGQG